MSIGSVHVLRWSGLIDQYRIKVDKRSGIVNDPNRVDAPRYIVDLIGQVISVSLQTVEIVRWVARVGCKVVGTRRVPSVSVV